MNVLFVCNGNVARSQMAEGYFNKFYSDEGHKAFSAGINPSREYRGRIISDISSDIIRCMMEEGIDLTYHFSKKISRGYIESSDLIVLMEDNSILHDLGKRKVIKWDVFNPKEMGYEEHCNVRDKIKKLVSDLAKEIK